MHCSRVDAFRHRADPIFADPAGAGHVYRSLTLTGTLTGRDPQKHALGLDPGAESGFAGQTASLSRDRARTNGQRRRDVPRKSSAMGCARY